MFSNFSNTPFNLDVFGFDKIGVAYPEGIPLFALRFVPAVCGSALTPTFYLILCELGLSPMAGGLAGILFLVGKCHKTGHFYNCICTLRLLAEVFFSFTYRLAYNK